MTAYYNEFEPYAAAWLRNLIKEGLIPDGIVDQRSIRDVQPSDLKDFTQCHFFAGLGGWACGARLAGWPDEREIWTGSPPCQPFSVAGKRAGAADDRHLWPDLFRLLRARRPTVFFGEQVAAAIGHDWLDGVCADLEGEDYACWAAVIPACAVNAPHRRDRLWFVAECSRERQHRRGVAREAGGNEFANSGGGGNVSESGGFGLSGRQDSAVGDDLNGPSTGWNESPGRPELCRAVNVVDDSRVGRGEGRAESEIRGGRPAVASTGGPGFGDTEGAGLQSADDSVETGTDGFNGGRGFALSSGALGAIPDAEMCGRSRQRLPSEGWGSPGGVEKDGLSNFWRDSIWLDGADGKARRVKPGVRLLAHGVPARVGRLRAYGNAIVPEVAAEIISAYLEGSAETLGLGVSA